MVGKYRVDSLAEPFLFSCQLTVGQVDGLSPSTVSITSRNNHFFIPSPVMRCLSLIFLYVVFELFLPALSLHCYVVFSYPASFIFFEIVKYTSFFLLHPSSFACILSSPHDSMSLNVSSSAIFLGHSSVNVLITRHKTTPQLNRGPPGGVPCVPRWHSLVRFWRGSVVSTRKVRTEPDHEQTVLAWF